ncbi:unnamed protein product [Fusarium graminearum]|nr:unnamed protein product [Fusarium graminearum]CAG2001435.1 unnamed protein product [Fusarium graminearum]
MCQFWVDNHPLTGENRTTIGPNCQKISCKYSEAGKIWRSMTGSPGAMQTARGNAAGGSLITIWHGTAGETPPTAYVNGRPVIDPNTNAEGSVSLENSTTIPARSSADPRISSRTPPRSPVEILNLTPSPPRTPARVGTRQGISYNFGIPRDIRNRIRDERASTERARRRRRMRRAGIAGMRERAGLRGRRDN